MPPQHQQGKQQPEDHDHQNEEGGADSRNNRPNLHQGEVENMEFLQRYFSTASATANNTTNNNNCYCYCSNNKCWDEIFYSIQIANTNPRIWYWSLLTFVVLCVIAVSLIVVISKDQDEDEEIQALALATETAQWFSGQLDRAILPLFSLAQFVKEIDMFYELADRIGPLDGQDSLPHIIPSSSSSMQQPPIITHRNVSGVCDDQIVLQRFNKVAKSIKDNAEMNGVLVSLQLVPYEVVCMVYPLINNEDFENDVIMNNTAAIGLDLLKDPNRISYAKAVIEESENDDDDDDVYIAGPLTLRECQLGGEDECFDSVEQAFIAALPIRSDNHSITIDGKVYKVWGSVEALINWKALIDRSHIFERFQEQQRGFQLSREDRIVDPDTGEETVQVTVLAETDDFLSGKYDHSTSTTLSTTDDLWQMTIVYSSASADWVGWAIALSVGFAFVVSLLVFGLLLERQKVNEIKTRYMNDVSQPQKNRLRLYLEDHSANVEPTPELERLILHTKPIADFYPNTTVVLVDMHGFTSWSSEREPSQVFKLLQTVYFAFDKIARKRSVFKIESLGGKYMAVTGLPNPQDDHVVRMVKFAQECSERFHELTKELEMTLGPSTADLKLRIGLSSGPVTAGVLLNEQSRFHLFGHTVRTAALMESTCEPNRIQLTARTADLLAADGRKKWTEPRKDLIYDRAMWDVQSYYLTTRRRLQKRGSDVTPTSNLSFCSDLSTGPMEEMGDQNDSDMMMILYSKQEIEGSEKTQRMIEWLVRSLLHRVKTIVATRKSNQQGQECDCKSSKQQKQQQRRDFSYQEGETILDEIKEVINLPSFDEAKKFHRNVKEVDLGKVVEDQIRSLARQIACLYHNNNAFHNLEHACHVTMAAQKLLDRIVTPDEVDYESHNAKKVAADLHNFSFGVASDPLLHFAIIYSAIIHDLDHNGVSNLQLAKENPQLAAKYRNHSIAECHAVALGWDLLMQAGFFELQSCLFSNQEEYQRLRLCCVHCVLATDFFDNKLKAFRHMRWERAFHGEELILHTSDFFDNPAALSLLPSDPLIGVTATSSTVVDKTHHKRSGYSNPSRMDRRMSNERGAAGDNKKMTQRNSSETYGMTCLSLSASERAKYLIEDSTNRKATIVIEHILQAADIMHTMQDWDVYRRWNERLFQEMSTAWNDGRAKRDPAESWVKGELWFFDQYVIPLANKLDDCCVFGVTSQECLFHAMENRRMWAQEGRRIVDEMVHRFYGDR